MENMYGSITIEENCTKARVSGASEKNRGTIFGCVESRELGAWSTSHTIAEDLRWLMARWALDL